MVSNSGAVLLGETMTDIEISEIVSRAAGDLGLVAGRPVADAKRDTRRTWGFDLIIPRLNSYSFQPKLGKNTLETLRLVIDRDPDASKAMTNFVLLINRGYKTVAGTKRKNGTVAPDPEGSAGIAELDERVGSEYGGGMRAVINVAINTLIHQGAIALEAELDSTLTDVIDCHPVDPSIIHFQREKGTGRLQRGVINQDAQFEELPARQFLYLPFHPMVGNPYGRSPILAALTALFFKVELLEDLRAVVHNQGHPRLDITVVMEHIEKAIPAYLRQKGKEAELRQFVQDEIKGVAEAYKGLNPDDSFIHGDNVTVEYKGPSGTFDFKSLSEILDNQIIAGVKQLPVLLGRNEGATTTHATVQWEIFATEIEAFQDSVIQAVQWFHNLGLAVRGRTSTATTTFQKPQTRDRKAEAEAEEIEIRNQFALADRGYVSDDEAANKLVGHGVVAEPKPQPAPAVPADSGSGTNTNASAITERSGSHGTIRQYHASGRVAAVRRERADHDPGDPGRNQGQEGGTHDHAGGQFDQSHRHDRADRTDRPQVHGSSRVVRGVATQFDAPDTYGTTVASGAIRLEPEYHNGEIVAYALVANNDTLRDLIRRTMDTMYPGPESGEIEEDLAPDELRDYLSEQRAGRLEFWRASVWAKIPYATKDTSPKNWAIHRRADGDIDHEAIVDDMIDDVLPDVQDRWDDLKERFPSRDVAEGKTTADEWFTTDAGIEWMGAFRTLLVDHYRDVFDVRGGLALQEIGIEGTFRLQNAEVIAALEEFGLQRVSGMADETISQILRVLQNGTANGDHPRDIARAIRAQIDGMSATRAYTIARTETAHAYSYAALECYDRNGVKKKEWLTANDRKVDPPCPDYQAEGAIPVRSRFGGRHDHPPAHPNCRCALIPSLEDFDMPDDDELWLGQ